MPQQDRKAREGNVVRRLTITAGATALGLAGYFTVSAATAVPIALGAGADAQQPPAGASQGDDQRFVRRVYVPASLQAPAGGVKAAGGQAATSGQSNTTAAPGTSAVSGTTPGTAPGSTAGPTPAPGPGTQPPATQPPPAPAATPPPTPTPAPTATTGGSTPAK